MTRVSIAPFYELRKIDAKQWNKLAAGLKQRKPHPKQQSFAFAEKRTGTPNAAAHDKEAVDVEAARIILSDPQRYDGLPLIWARIRLQRSGADSVMVLSTDCRTRKADVKEGVLFAVQEEPIAPGLEDWLVETPVATTSVAITPYVATDDDVGL